MWFHNQPLFLYQLQSNTYIISLLGEHLLSTLQSTILKRSAYIVPKVGGAGGVQRYDITDLMYSILVETTMHEMGEDRVGA